MTRVRGMSGPCSQPGAQADSNSPVFSLSKITLVVLIPAPAP